MESERLRKLKEQRDVILGHLDWLNLEIDRETISSSPSKSPETNRLIEAIDEDRPISKSFEIESKPQEAVATDIYDELGPDTKNAVADTKKGCLLIGGLAFAAFAAICGYVIFFY